MDLKELIQNSGFKIKYLAKKLGIRYETLYFKLKGEKDFTQSEIRKLCEILNIPSDRVLDFF